MVCLDALTALAIPPAKPPTAPKAAGIKAKSGKNPPIFLDASTVIPIISVQFQS